MSLFNSSRLLGRLGALPRVFHLTPLLAATRPASTMQAQRTGLSRWLQCRALSVTYTQSNIPISRFAPVAFLPLAAGPNAWRVARLNAAAPPTGKTQPGHEMPDMLVKGPYHIAPLRWRVLGSFLRVIHPAAELMFVAGCRMASIVLALGAAFLCLAWRRFTYLRSQDVGYVHVGLYIVDKDGKAVPWWKLFLREVLLGGIPFVGQMLLLVDMGLCLWDTTTSRSLVDRIFDTYVVVGPGPPPGSVSYVEE